MRGTGEAQHKQIFLVVVTTNVDKEVLSNNNKGKCYELV